MKYVIDTIARTSKPLSEYITQDAVQETANAKSLNEFKDFTRDICHHFGISLETSLPELKAQIAERAVKPETVKMIQELHKDLHFKTISAIPQAVRDQVKCFKDATMVCCEENRRLRNLTDRQEKAIKANGFLRMELEARKMENINLATQLKAAKEQAGYTRYWAAENRMLMINAELQQQQIINAKLLAEIDEQNKLLQDKEQNLRSIIGDCAKLRSVQERHIINMVAIRSKNNKLEKIAAEAIIERDRLRAELEILKTPAKPKCALGIDGCPCTTRGLTCKS